MPQIRNKTPEVMTWAKASKILVVAGIFDALRYFFLFFWLSGPAMIAIYCSAKVGDTAVIGGLLEKGCVAGAVALGLGGAPALIAFGTIMAIAFAYAGWVFAVFIIAATNSRALSKNPRAILWVFAGLGASVLLMVWGIYKAQIKKESAALKKYEQEQATQQEQAEI